LSPGGWLAGLRQMGRGQVSFFFFYSFLFLYFLCYVSYLNFNSFFADSEFRSVLKYINDIISPNMCYYIYHVCALAHKMLKYHWDLSRVLNRDDLSTPPFFVSIVF
jgi:hypothetical protein